MDPSTLVQENTQLPENVKIIDGGYQSEVKYYPGKTVLGGKSAILRWQNDTISLIQLPDKEGQAPTTIFSVHPNQIESIDKYTTVLGFHTSQGNFKVEFSYKAGIMIGAAGGMKSAGVIAAVAGRQTAGKSGGSLLTNSGYFWWVEKLKSQNIKFKQPKALIFVLIGLFIFLIIIILLPKA